MCLFPVPNPYVGSSVYRKGLIQFDCGACPECLRKRSNVWALRAVYESKLHSDNCMVTLTYDNYARDKNGHIIGELPPDRDLHVCKRDIQLFIKRLRKKFGAGIKFICTAEYGSTTHRAHYHCIFFGLKFPDLIYYKKSKRGNRIYKSPLLTKIWGHGICTVDNININSSVARYCTKYCAKFRSEDTFMLSSQKIGFAALLSDFNGKSYFLEGREYPIPKFIWQYYISQKYFQKFPFLSYKYVNLKYSDDDSRFILNLEEYLESRRRNYAYRIVRDSDPLYVSYIAYWKHKGQQFEQTQLTPLQRIYNLDDRKYHNYKVAALDCYYKRKAGYPKTAPGSHCFSFERRHLWNERAITCPVTTCPNRASDTVSEKLIEFNCFSTPFSSLKSIIKHKDFIYFNNFDCFA